jgi:acyl carrier protein
MTTGDAEVLAEIQRIAREDLGLARAVAPGDELARDLGLDSLQLQELAVALEDRFRVALTSPDAARARTIGDVVALVRRSREGGA